MKLLFTAFLHQRKWTFILFIALALFSQSCTKGGPDGPPGIDGPTGPTGATGAPGPAGPTGATGSQGNANVTSGTATLTNTNYVNSYWSITTGPNSSLGVGAKKATITVPSITANIFNTGAVLVYFKVPDGLSSTLTNWVLLPFSIKSFSGDYFISLKSNYEIGKINIYYMFDQTNAAVTIPSIFSATVPDYTFKYIVIAGSQGGRPAMANIDYNDYSAVCRYYKIPE